MVGGRSRSRRQRGTFVAFEAGVKAVRADADRARDLHRQLGQHVGREGGPRAAQLREGADVLIHNVDAASFAFFQVGARGARKGAAWRGPFGMNRDQNDVAPDVIVGSAVIDYTGMFLRTAEAWRGRDSGR